MEFIILDYQLRRSRMNISKKLIIVSEDDVIPVENLYEFIKNNSGECFSEEEFNNLINEDYDED